MKKISYFLSIYEQLKVPEILFDPSWKNGSGYLNNIVSFDLGLKPGQLVKFKDDLRRHCIVISTRFGNIAFFKRYSDISSDVVACNAPHEVKEIAMGDMSSSISKEKLMLYIGVVSITDTTVSFGGRNIGKRLEYIRTLFTTEGVENEQVLETQENQRFNQ